MVEKGVGGQEIHRRMKAVYGECNLCRSSVVKWRKRFLKGRELQEDDARHGQAHRIFTPEMIAEMNALVLNNRRNFWTSMTSQASFL
ncbi:histone-lysine N-methyltransferase SETMAR [Trichonephila clavipes]|nr:histone-lysine N-methyltransferase SETMAR [Trichonephila clavipes]